MPKDCLCSKCPLSPDTFSGGPGCPKVPTRPCPDCRGSGREGGNYQGGWKPDGVECKRCGGNGVVIAI